MTTLMVGLERSGSQFIKSARTSEARVKEIGKIFSLMATVEQHGSRIKFAALVACMKACGVETGGGDTTEGILSVAGGALRSKINTLRPIIRREQQRLRMSAQVAYGNARKLRKLA